MSVSWKSWPDLVCICICLSLCPTEVVSKTFQLAPLNATVLQGSDARFNATVQGDWRFMTWTVEGLLVLTVPIPGNITSFSERYSARFCSSDISCVEFTIHNVTRTQSGPVVCAVQGDFGSKTAQLNVQESGLVNIVGGNVTVVATQQAEFQCVASAWFPIPTVSWTQNGQAVNSSLYNTTTVTDGNSFNLTSILKFQAFSSATVECWASVPTLTNPKSSSVFMKVVPKPTDWTVLIATVVSIGGFALLVLIILAIIFCYKRRKENQTTYQDEMSRRVRTQSQISAVSGGRQRHGHVNAGYLPEGQTNVGPTEPTETGFNRTYSNILEMPDIVNHAANTESYQKADNTVDESEFMKHRHLTIV